MSYLDMDIGLVAQSPRQVYKNPLDFGVEMVSARLKVLHLLGVGLYLRMDMALELALLSVSFVVYEECILGLKT